MKNKIFLNARKQSGQAFILALIMLALGGLIIAPLMGLMFSGLKAGQIVETRTDELYASGAGVEYALWYLRNTPGEIPETVSLNIPDINGKNTDIQIDNLGTGYDFKITSSSQVSGSNKTTITSYVKISSGFDYILDNAIASPGTIDLKNKIPVEGPVMGEVTGAGADDLDDGQNIPLPENASWPYEALLKDFYINQVNTVDDLYGSSTININLLSGTPKTLGPLYREGNLSIDGNSLVTLYLSGTLYIKGDLTIGSSNGNPTFSIDLDGYQVDISDPKFPQTIFVEGNIIVKSNAQIEGSGAIIATGNILFNPKMNTTPTDYVLVMTTIRNNPDNPEDPQGGGIIMRPSGSFYGTIAGEVSVDIQSGSEPYYAHTDPPPNLNFPGENNTSSGHNVVLIRSWEINTS